MFYMPKGSQIALNHWNGTGFLLTEKSVLVQKDREIN